LNQGPPTLEANTLQLGYRGGGKTIGDVPTNMAIVSAREAPLDSV